MPPPFFRDAELPIEEVPMSRYTHTRRFVILVALSTPLLSCGRHESNETYVFVSNNIQIPYWRQAAAGFTASAAQLKVHVKVVGPATFDPKAEQAALQQAVREKPAGILVHVAEPALLTFDIDQAIASGIPVITLDSDAPASKRLLFIGTNNFEAGLLGGQRLAQLLKEKGNVVFFTISEQNNLADRLRGYREALVRYPQIHIIRTVDIGGNPDIASNTVAQILAQHPGDVDAFVCLEALAGRNVAIALNERHVQNKIVLAMDTDPDTLDWIDKGVISATIAQKPYTMTMVGLRVLDDLHHYPPPRLTDNWSQDSFAPIPAFIDTGSDIIDKSNLAAYRQSR
jgi:ribose transport system substrate-binding protein